MLSSTLKQARIDSGKTLKQVSSDLKIRRLYLEALEEGSFDILPGKVYIKGYLRLYSQYLNICDPLFLRQFDDDNLPQRKKVVVYRNKTLVNFKYKIHFVIISILMLFIIAIIYSFIIKN